MKQLLIIIIAILPLSGMAQKRKTFTVVRTVQQSFIDGTIYYDSLNKPVDTLFILFGRDARYTHIVSHSVLYSGSLQEIYDLLKHSLAFFIEEEKGTSETYKGIDIYVDKLMGIKYLGINSKDKYDNGYTTFGQSGLVDLLSGIDRWSKKNQIAIK